MYIKEAIKKEIVTKERLDFLENTLNTTKKNNPKALIIKDKEGNETNFIKEYKKFLNSEITLEELDEMYVEFLTNSLKPNIPENTINVVKSIREIIRELKAKAKKEGRFAYVYISKTEKEKFNPQLLKKTIENIQKKHGVNNIKIKDLEDMPMIYGVVDFPATFIYNKDKIQEDPEEAPVEMIIAGYYL